MGLIADIIAAAIGSATTTELLNKALVAATRLSDDQMSQFATREIHGYDGAELPTHRMLRGQLRGNDPWQGWLPVMVPRNCEFLEVARFGEGVAELESLVGSAEGGEIVQHYGPGRQGVLREMFKTESDVLFALVVQRAAVVQSLQRSRTIVLEWALALEKQGVHGENMTFTPADRQVATQVTNNLINNGVMHSPQIQQGSSGGQHIQLSPDLQALAALMSQILAHLSELGSRASEAEADARTVLAQLNSGKPKEGVVRECLESLKSILEGAGGAWVATEILPRMTPYLANIGTMIASLGA